MEPTTAEEVDQTMLLSILQRIDFRLAHLEALFAQYEPLLTEAARRMAGPIKWRK